MSDDHASDPPDDLPTRLRSERVQEPDAFVIGPSSPDPLLDETWPPGAALPMDPDKPEEGSR